MRVSSARTSKDLNFFFVCQVVLFVGILVCLSAIWLTKMLANKPKCWQTNQNAGKQTKMLYKQTKMLYKQTKILTNKPKFWQANQNCSKQTKFVCQNFGLLKFKFNKIPISHLETKTPYGLVFICQVKRNLNI